MPRGRRDPLINDPPSGGTRAQPRRDGQPQHVPLRGDADCGELPGAAAEVPAGLPREREDPEQ